MIRSYPAFMTRTKEGELSAVFIDEWPKAEVLSQSVLEFRLATTATKEEIPYIEGALRLMQKERQRTVCGVKATARSSLTP